MTQCGGENLVIVGWLLISGPSIATVLAVVVRAFVVLKDQPLYDGQDSYFADFSALDDRRTAECRREGCREVTEVSKGAWQSALARSRVHLWPA